MQLITGYIISISSSHVTGIQTYKRLIKLHRLDTGTIVPTLCFTYTIKKMCGYIIHYSKLSRHTPIPPQPPKPHSQNKTTTTATTTYNTNFQLYTLMYHYLMYCRKLSSKYYFLMNKHSAALRPTSYILMYHFVFVCANL